MNDSFFHLPEEKRTALINAALRVFSQHGYRKSPMNEIAAEAGISKSLLFYYFRNKKELYLYLAQYCAEVNRKELIDNDCYKGGFFDILTSGLKVKVGQMRRYPELALFELRGYFESDPAIKKEIRALIDSYSQLETQMNMAALDTSEFIDGLDIAMMYRTIFYAAEGFLWEFLNRDGGDPDELERGYMAMIDHWKHIYLRKGAE